MQYRFFCTHSRKMNHFRTRIDKRDTQCFMRLSELPEELENRRIAKAKELRSTEIPNPAAKSYIRRMLKRCAKPPDYKRAIHWIRKFEYEGHPPDVGLYTAVMSVCAKGSAVVATTMLLKEMREKGLKPNQVTYSTLLTAYARHLRVDKVKELLKDMRKDKVDRNLILYGGAMNCFAKAGLSDETLKLLEDMKHDSITPDQMIHNSVAESFLRGGKFHEAVDYFESVKNDEEHPADIIMYNVAINACAKARDGGRALAYLAEIKERGLQLSTLTYNQVIDALVRSENTRAAFEVFEEMRIRKLPVHSVTFASLMNGCTAPENVSRALHLFQLCKAEHPKELDDVVYFSVIKVLHAHHRFDEIDSIYLHAYRTGVLSHWFPSSAYWFDLHDFTPSCASAALRCGFLEILNDFEQFMIGEILENGEEILYEPIEWPAMRRGVEVLAWRADTEAGDLIPAGMIEMIQDTLKQIDVSIEAEPLEEHPYQLVIPNEQIFKLLHMHTEQNKKRWVQAAEHLSRQQERPRDDAWDLVDSLDQHY